MSLICIRKNQIIRICGNKLFGVKRLPEVLENKEFGEGEKYDKHILKCDKYILFDDKEIFVYNLI